MKKGLTIVSTILAASMIFVSFDSVVLAKSNKSNKGNHYGWTQSQGKHYGLIKQGKIKAEEEQVNLYNLSKEELQNVLINLASQFTPEELNKDGAAKEIYKDENVKIDANYEDGRYLFYIRIYYGDSSVHLNATVLFGEEQADIVIKEDGIYYTRFGIDHFVSFTDMDLNY